MTDDEYIDWEEIEYAPSGADLIYTERRRQINDEGWTAQHDDQYTRFELSMAACAYLVAGSSELTNRFWPWDWRIWKPTTHTKNLIKAGALIAAEIDRLLRLETGRK